MVFYQVYTWLNRGLQLNMSPEAVGPQLDIAIFKEVLELSQIIGRRIGRCCVEGAGHQINATVDRAIFAAQSKPGRSS
jgi:hypothetical protein